MSLVYIYTCTLFIMKATWIDLLIIFSLPKLVPCLDINDPKFDGVVVVTDTVQKLLDNKLVKVAAAVEEYAKVSYFFLFQLKYPVLGFL